MKYLRGNSINQIEIADDFCEAYERCFESGDDGHFVSIPAFTNGLFACELYLKYLLGNNIDRVRKNERHNLCKLFNALDESIKNELKMVKCDSRYSLQSLLSDIGDGFVSWRYIFEDGNESFGEGRPFEYSDYFLKTYLPALKEIAHKYNSNKEN